MDERHGEAIRRELFELKEEFKQLRKDLNQHLSGIAKTLREWYELDKHHRGDPI